jgi:hypothetical protein
MHYGVGPFRRLDSAITFQENRMRKTRVDNHQCVSQRFDFVYSLDCDNLSYGFPPVHEAAGISLGDYAKSSANISSMRAVPMNPPPAGSVRPQTKERGHQVN